jgi:predicted nucleic acid-binding protein
MTVFVDTSAILAVLDADDVEHEGAAESWRRELRAGTSLLTSNYVVVETLAVVQRRLGLAATRELATEVLPALVVEWVTQADHAAGLAGLLAAGRKRLSLVDCTSFEVMRRLGIDRAFAFDRHFGEQGFDLVA